MCGIIGYSENIVDCRLFCYSHSKLHVTLADLIGKYVREGYSKIKGDYYG